MQIQLALEKAERREFVHTNVVLAGVLRGWITLISSEPIWLVLRVNIALGRDRSRPFADIFTHLKIDDVDRSA